MIRIRYSDGKIASIPNNQLERMIRGKRILGFERNSGWVSIETGPLRAKSAGTHRVPERRAELAYRMLLADIDQPAENKKKAGPA